MENILHCGVYIHSYSKNQTYWSPGIYSILDIDAETVQPSYDAFEGFVLADDKEKLRSAVQRSQEEYVPYSLEFSLLSGRGIYKRVKAEIFFKRDEAGTVEERRGIMKDITESYFYKRALEQKVLQLDKSNRNLQEFVYVASHDLQEPLRKISTFIERLSSRFEDALGQEGNMYVKRIMNSSQNMQTLLEDLLSFSRLSFQDKSFETFSLRACLDSVLSDLEVKIEETKTTVVYDDLPEIEGYHSQIKQLFVNLISNAIKFRKPDERPVIRIRSALVGHDRFPDLPLLKSAKYVMLEVEDNGIGFEQEFADRIFMIFQRLNAKAEYAGSGIGLAICKKIADNHHGFISGRGEPDKGAVFTVVLPQRQT